MDRCICIVLCLWRWNTMKLQYPMGKNNGKKYLVENKLYFAVSAYYACINAKHNKEQINTQIILPWAQKQLAIWINTLFAMKWSLRCYLTIVMSDSALLLTITGSISSLPVVHNRLWSKWVSVVARWQSKNFRRWVMILLWSWTG